MGYILPHIYQELAREKHKELPITLIETGTFKGGIAHRFLETYGNIDPFKKIYTFELGEDICKIASNRFKLFDTFMGDFGKFSFHTDNKDEEFSKSGSYFYDSITLIHDDSVNGLKSLLPTLKEPSCFWLDAHAGAAKYARGPKDVPLIDEIIEIEKTGITDHIIAIDDAHLFGSKQYDKYTGEVNCDYSEITFELVKNALMQINSNYTVKIINPFNHEMLVAY